MRRIVAVVPLGVPHRPPELGGTEVQLAPDMFARIGRCVLFDPYGHPVGRAVTAGVGGGRLMIHFKVSKTDAGLDLVTLVADGSIDAVRLNMTPVTVRRVRESDRALYSYSSADILGVLASTATDDWGAMLGRDVASLDRRAARDRLGRLAG